MGDTRLTLQGVQCQANCKYFLPLLGIQKKQGTHIAPNEACISSVSNKQALQSGEHNMRGARRENG